MCCILSLGWPVSFEYKMISEQTHLSMRHSGMLYDVVSGENIWSVSGHSGKEFQNPELGPLNSNSGLMLMFL